MSLTAFAKSPAYRNALRALRNQLALTILPDYVDAVADERRLRQARVALDELEEILASERREFLAFTRLKLTQTDAAEDDADHSDGHRRRRAPTVEELGYDRGFLVVCLVEFALARRRPGTLTSHLKAMRIPAAEAYAEQLAAFYQQATAEKRPARKPRPPTNTRANPKATAKPRPATRKPVAKRPAAKKPARSRSRTRA
jgi:hypothetical protein